MLYKEKGGNDCEKQVYAHNSFLFIIWKQKNEVHSTHMISLRRSFQVTEKVQCLPT